MLLGSAQQISALLGLLRGGFPGIASLFLESTERVNENCHRRLKCCTSVASAVVNFDGIGLTLDCLKFLDGPGDVAASGARCFIQGVVPSRTDSAKRVNVTLPRFTGVPLLEGLVRGCFLLREAPGYRPAVISRRF